MSAQPRQNVPPTGMLGNRVAFAYLDDVSVMISTVEKWTDADLLEFLETSARLGNHVTAAGNVTHFFGDIFGTSHRKMIVDFLTRHNMTATPRNALLTDSALMKGALTAYSWLTKAETKAFHPTDVDAMCAWLTRGLAAKPEAVKSALQACYRIVGK